VEIPCMHISRNAWLMRIRLPVHGSIEGKSCAV
jgi:hypothetical protein